jgi:hypothetical protein
VIPELKEGIASRNFQALHPIWKSAVYHAARDFGVAQTAWIAQLPGRSTPTCFSLILNSRKFLDEEEADEIFERAISLLGVPMR